MAFLEFVNPWYKILDEHTDKKEIVLRNGHIALTNYIPGDNVNFERSLSIFDKIYWSHDMVAGYYIKELKEFRLGRGYELNRLTKFFPDRIIRVENLPVMPGKVDYKLLSPPKSDFQKVALTFMASQYPYTKNKGYTQQIIDADTGDGKTYCGVAISAYFHAKVVVICPISTLIEQWKDSFLRFTTLTEKQILIVRGSNKCDKILNGEYKNTVVFLFSSDTISSYIKTRGHQACIEMIWKTDAYLKIIDEIHKDFRIVSQIEAMCNIPMNYYMSATPRRTDNKENWIFSTLYHNVPRFGSKFKQKDERHINIIIKEYQFFPTELQIKAMYNPRVGLNPKSYEKVLLSSSSMQRKSFEKACVTMLGWSKSLVKDDNKILILCHTVDGTKFMETIANKIFPDQCSHYYSTGMKKDEKERALKKKVICATASSMGTGADIKNLQHVINICTYSNAIDAVQFPGRARKRSDGVPVVYIELVNMAYKKTINQFLSRKPHLTTKAANGKLMIIH